MTGSPNGKMAFITRNGGSITSAHPDSAWRDYMIANGGSGYGNTEIERKFLAAKGFATGTLADQWSAYLASKSFTTGSLAERYRTWLTTGTP
jgi:hypothetical protein